MSQKINKVKLKELSDEIEILDAKILDHQTEVSTLENIKRLREIELEEALHGDWTDEELMRPVV